MQKIEIIEMNTDKLESIVGESTRKTEFLS
jgi:hypothetical protein